MSEVLNVVKLINDLEKRNGATGTKKFTIHERRPVDLFYLVSPYEVHSL